MSLRKIVLLSALMMTVKAVSATPANDAYLQGHDLNDQAKFADALPLLNKAIELDPTFADAYVSRGYSYGKLGSLDKAILDYEKAIQLDGKNKYAINNRGFIYLKLGRNDKAIEDFDKVISLDPEYEASYANRAEAELRAERYDKAIADCQKAISLDSRDADPYQTRGDVFAKQGELIRAISDYTTAIDLKPSIANTFHQLGEANFRRAEMYNLLASKEIEQSSAQGFPAEAAQAVMFLKQRIEATADPSELQKAVQQRVVTGQFKMSSLMNNDIEIQLTQPISARLFSNLMGWSAPYLVSPDVHQNTWEVHLQNMQAQTTGSRIATTIPKIGQWQVRAWVQGRPQGDLPSTVAGASPAYNLGSYDSDVLFVRVARQVD